jgi:hypothetical protein
MNELCEGFRDGTGKTTVRDFVNSNGQRCCGHRGVPGNDHGQIAYKMHCENPANPGCSHFYGANGSDVFQRKCPECQGGQPGIPF